MPARHVATGLRIVKPLTGPDETNTPGLEEGTLRPIRSLGLRLARIEAVRRAIAERADLSPFRARPSFRLLLGVGLIGLSMLLGWPLIGFLGVLAIWSAEPLVAIVGGPAAYGLSWAVYGAGLLIAGREALYYAGVFNRWCVRVVVIWMTGEPEEEIVHPDETGPRPE